MNQPYATLTLASALREMFGVQLYKNNARVLLSRILSIVNSDWLQHARSVRGVFEVALHSLLKTNKQANKRNSLVLLLVFAQVIMLQDLAFNMRSRFAQCQSETCFRNAHYSEWHTMRV